MCVLLNVQSLTLIVIFLIKCFSPFQIHCSITNTWSRGFSVVEADDTNLFIEKLALKLTLSTYDSYMCLDVCMYSHLYARAHIKVTVPPAV